MKPRAPALNVRWHDGRLVGRVVTTGPTHFAYDDEWLVGGHSLSPLAVPFTNTAFRQRADASINSPAFSPTACPTNGAGV